MRAIVSLACMGEMDQSMGVLMGIYVAGKKGETLYRVNQARAIQGRGLEGDRYFSGIGSFSRWPGGGRAVSLISQEAIDGIVAEHQIDLSNGRSRRNLVTRGIDLNELVGRWFSIGDVVLFGDRRCLPCRYLERMLGTGTYEAMKNRGGLRADVRNDGDIREGDTIKVLANRPKGY